jgi:integrase
MSSLYKDAKSPFWQVDIWIDGHKLQRSTRCTRERDAKLAAEQIEKELRAEITEQGETKLASLALDYIAERWLRDVGDHHRGEGPKINEYKIAKLIEYFGPDRSLKDIGHDDALKLILWRRKHTVGKRKRRPIGPHAINDTTEQLKKFFTYCRRNHRVTFKDEPTWKDLWQREPQERERHLSQIEADRLDDALEVVRDDYEPLFQFSMAAGKRKSECMTLEWSHVKWDRDMIEREGKGGRIVQVAITDTVREILWPLRGQHPKFVFSFVAKRTVDKVIKGRRYTYVKGQRYPITKDGLRRVWNNVREKAGLPMQGPDRFRYHDLRHDFATKLLHSVQAETPAAALKIVQKALDHAKITTTMRYAHVTADDVAAGIEAVAQARRQRRRHKDHRTDHRSRKVKVV